MTYFVITDEGLTEHGGVPTYDELTALVGGGLVEMVRAQPVVDGPHVFWMNEDAFMLEAAGTLSRNVIGTVLAITLGASIQPYPGPLVLTGVELDPMEGYSPADLPVMLSVVLPDIYGGMARILAGEDVEGVPATIIAGYREAAEFARTSGVPETVVMSLGQDGQWTRH